VKLAKTLPKQPDWHKMNSENNPGLGMWAGLYQRKAGLVFFKAKLQIEVGLDSEYPFY